MPAQDNAGMGGGTSSPPPPDQGNSLGLTVHWFGSFDAFCALAGICGEVRNELKRSLADDDEFLNLSQRQQFISAETGIRHLRKLAQERRNGVGVSGRAANRPPRKR